MKKHLILFSLFLIFVSCERGWIRNLISSEDEIADTIGPTVVISSHTSGQTVSEIIMIVADTEDDGGISKVEFFIDDLLVLTDTESPYQYDWNTTQYESNSEHIIKVISYDNSDNSTISQSILLKVDHTSSLPNGGNITSVIYTLTEMTVEWEESTDGDFNDYKVLYSGTENGDRDTLETYTDKSTTSYTITEFNPLIENWFWVQVTDTLGLSSIGSSMTNEIDSPPSQIDISSVTYDLTEMVVSWNQSSDNDFLSYELLYTETQSGEQTSIITITDVNTTSFTISDFNPLEERWYWIRVTDYWNLTTMSNDYMVLDNPPTPSVIYPNNDGFQIIWSQNNDDDFVSYKLYESLSGDMSNKTLVYETNDRTNISFDLTIEILKYYQITIEDYWGLQSTSNIEFGDYYIELWGESYSVPNTTELFLSGLSGSIPSEIGNLTNLESLYLNNNQLTGLIPSEIGNLTNLTDLRLSSNQLTGSIPSEIGNLTNLERLWLNDNQLTGSIPPEIGNLTNLERLYLNDNQLTGEISGSICSLINLQLSNDNNFSISNNQLCPPYPSCVEENVGYQDTSGCD